MTHTSTSPQSETSGDTASSDGGSVLSDLRHPIETALESACEFGDGCPDHLASAMRYALLAPGKRLRPILVLMSAEACCFDSAEKSSATKSIAENPQRLSEVMPGAVAVEMIHAYSLIHDDLPAMDDDDLRRGRPTVHIEFDEATAILAGDALQAEAFRHLVGHIDDPSKAAAAVSILASAAGASHLVGGQADDLKAENDHHPDSLHGTDSSLSRVDWLESIHRRKTGALFSASLDLGAVLTGANAQQRSALAAYANHLGLAFQVVDDYLDFTADDAVLGKRAGKDAERGKLTYPGLLGAEQARIKAVKLIESAKQEALFFGPAAKRLLWLADYVLERTH